MKRSSVIGATAVALAAVGCSQDRPTEQVSDLPPVTAALASSSNNCQANTHPGGTIVDKILTPPAWAMAVRDDGLAYFTEAYNAGVGITSTRTKTLDGFIATGQAPTGVAFSPDGATAYVANQLSENVSVINVATAQVVATISTGAADPFAVQVSPDGSSGRRRTPSSSRRTTASSTSRHSLARR